MIKLYQILARKNDPWLSYIDSNILSNDLEHASYGILHSASWISFTYQVWTRSTHPYLT